MTARRSGLSTMYVRRWTRFEHLRNGCVLHFCLVPLAAAKTWPYLSPIFLPGIFSYSAVWLAFSISFLYSASASNFFFTFGAELSTLLLARFSRSRNSSSTFSWIRARHSGSDRETFHTCVEFYLPAAASHLSYGSSHPPILISRSSRSRRTT